MSDQAWYKEWFNSPCYHKLYFERDEQEAVQFMNKLIDFLQPAPKSFVLDVACGRGRHSRILADKGFIVTGIDISPASIDFAKKNERENLEFFQHDMRSPFRVNYYDYAFNFFTSFGYFATKREHDDSLRMIANSLKKNGIFVMDYLNIHFTEERLVANEEKIINGTTYEIHRWQDEKHFFKKISIRDPLLMYPEEHTEIVTKFSLGDFTDMLSYQHLQIQEIFGDYQLTGYDIKSKPRLIIVAKKE